MSDPISEELQNGSLNPVEGESSLPKSSFNEDQIKLGTNEVFNSALGSQSAEDPDFNIPFSSDIQSNDGVSEPADVAIVKSDDADPFGAQEFEPSKMTQSLSPCDDGFGDAFGGTNDIGNLTSTTLPDGGFPSSADFDYQFGS